MLDHPLSSRHCSAVNWPSPTPGKGVAEEDHVELRELVEPVRKLLDVVLVPSPRLAQAGLEEQAGDLDARVARQCISQVAILPPRVRLDDQDLELLLADRDRLARLVVVGEGLVGVLGDFERERHVTRRPRLPDDPVGRPAHRGNLHLLLDLVPFRGPQRDRRHVLAGQRVLSIVNGMRTDLPATPRVGGVQAEKLDIGQADAAPDRHGEDRHPARPKPRGGLDGRRPLVPVAVRSEDDPAEVANGLGGLGQAGRPGRSRARPWRRRTVAGRRPSSRGAGSTMTARRSARSPRGGIPRRPA